MPQSATRNLSRAPGALGLLSIASKQPEHGQPGGQQLFGGQELVQHWRGVRYGAKAASHPNVKPAHAILDDRRGA